MAKTKADLLADRSGPERGITLRENFVNEGAARLARAMLPRWPTDRWKLDPVGFVLTVLGVRLIQWQIDLCEEVVRCIREGRPVRTSVASGHKIGKSLFICCLAIWFYCTFHKARAIMTSTTAHQVRDILWREFRIRTHEAPIKLDAVPGDTPKAGLKCPATESEIEGQREVIGFTAREAEAMQGISGEAVWFFADEASGVRQEIFDAIEGNRAASAWSSLFGNPTKNEGEHFDSFHRKARFYYHRRVSSREVAKERHPDGSRIKGLVTEEWIAEKDDEFGPDSAFVKIRVDGQHALEEERKSIALHWIWKAQEEWSEERVQEAIDKRHRLRIGIDVAGEGPEGDYWVFCVVRGDCEIERATIKSGITMDEAREILFSLLLRHRLPGEVPLVIPDCTGKNGAEFYGILAAVVRDSPNLFDLWWVNSARPAAKWPKLYSSRADELVANLGQWLHSGAIVKDERREQELHFREWRTIQKGPNLVMKLHPSKDTMRTKAPEGIGRSPDRADALALAVWEPSLVVTDEELREANTTDSLVALERAAPGVAAPGPDPREWFDAVEEPLDPVDALEWTKGH